MLADGKFFKVIISNHFVTDMFIRFLLITSSFVMTAAMMTMGGLGVNMPVTDSRKNGIVSMISIFACGFSIGWAPMTYVVTTEVSALRLRDLTARVGFTANVIFK